jgi:hypothetical protein
VAAAEQCDEAFDKESREDAEEEARRFCCGGSDCNNDTGCQVHGELDEDSGDED